jgi:hypothetical protein
MNIVIDEKPSLCDKHSFEYYPTVLFFKKGKVHKRLDTTPKAGLTKKQRILLADNLKNFKTVFAAYSESFFLVNLVIFIAKNLRPLVFCVYFHFVSISSLWKVALLR